MGGAPRMSGWMAFLAMTVTVRRASSAPPCGSGGRVLVQQGTMALSRAF